MSVKRYGQVSGIQYGEVEDTDISGEWLNIYFSDLFSTDISTAEGDSGAAFNYIVEIMKGGLGGYDTSVGIKIKNIIAKDVWPST